MQKVIIFGNRSSARMAYYSILDDPEIEVVGFTVDLEYLNEDNFLNLPVLPFSSIEKNFAPSEFKIYISIGSAKLNTQREKKFLEAKAKGYEFLSFVHPRAVVSRDVIIGENCFIYANAVLQPGVKLGDNIIVKENCVIGHDSEVGDNCYLGISSAISGYVKIARNSFIGTNSTIKDNIKVAAQTLVGAGVTILKNTREGQVFYSNNSLEFPFAGTDLL